MGGLQREILELKSVVMNVTHEMTMQVRVDELSGQKVILAITHPLIISYQYTLPTHPLNTPSQTTLLTYSFAQQGYRTEVPCFPHPHLLCSDQPLRVSGQSPILYITTLTNDCPKKINELRAYCNTNIRHW